MTHSNWENLEGKHQWVESSKLTEKIQTWSMRGENTFILSILDYIGILFISTSQETEESAKTYRREDFSKRI